MGAYRFASLQAIKKYEPAMRSQGVSQVARSPRGFLTAYKRAGGKGESLSPYWKKRREGFIKRHWAQVIKHREALTKNGKPTRRALAFIAWAWMPPLRG